MRTTRSLRVSDEAWGELEKRANFAGVAGRGEYLERLMSVEEKAERPVVLATPGHETTERASVLSLEQAWERLSDDEKTALKWSRLALRAFYNAVVGG